MHTKWIALTGTAILTIALQANDVFAQNVLRRFGRPNPNVPNQPNLRPGFQPGFQPGQPFVPNQPCFQPGFQPGQPFVPGQPNFQPGFQPGIQQPLVPRRRGVDLDDLVDDILDQRFPRCFGNARIRVGRGVIDVQVNVNNFNDFCRARDYIRRQPQFAGYRVQFCCRNLEDLIENRIERGLGRYVDDVDVDVDHRRRCIDIEVELCHPAGYGALRSMLASMPELAGYRVRLDVEYDD